MRHISEEHLKHMAEHGYVIVEDLLTPEELAAVRKELSLMFPDRASYDYARMLYQDAAGVRHLPHLGDVLNFVAVDPEIVSFAERVLGTKRITLVTSHVWAKYPGTADFDQALHTDYRSGSILYPDRQRRFEDFITFIIYYADVDERLGPTYVVSERHSRDELLVPDIRYRHDSPELYRHERPVRVRAGSALIYNTTVFHRASALTSADGIRYSHHISYQSDEARWGGVSVWAPAGFTPELGHLLGQATPRQRELFGFPPPGDAYWKEGTLRGVAARYPTVDMTPYVAAADIPQRQKARLREELKLPRPNKTGMGASYYGGPPAEGSGDASPRLAADYCRGVADYCAAMTGVPAGYWLPWLLAYYRMSTRR